MRNKQRLLTPGPTPLPEEVRLALARDTLHHRKDAFKAVLRECREPLKTLFGAAQEVMPLAATGTGGMVAAVANCFNPGDKVLVVEAGKFGQRWTQIARAHGLEVERLEVPWGRAVEPEEVRKLLGRDPGLAGVLVQASETSTGVLHPVRELGEMCRERETLLVVDGISAVGVSPLPMDAWGVDCLVTGSQKGLMLPTGLALIALSERAWARAEAAENHSFYFNLPGERKKMADGQTLFSSPVNMLVALKASLDLFMAEGLERHYAKQWALTQLARAGAQAMGLELLAPVHFTWGLTAIKVPAGLDGQALLAHAQDKHGVIMAGGQDALKGRIVRLGHMGHTDWADVAAGLHALAASLRAVGGYTACRDYLEQGLAAYDSALEAGPPMA